MALSSLRQLPELHNERRDGDVARGYFRNLKVDVLLTSNPVFEEVRKCHAVMQRFVEQDIPCATVEGLILLKLYALPSLYRQGNFIRVGLYENDVATLIQTYSPSIEPLLDRLPSYLTKVTCRWCRRSSEKSSGGSVASKRKDNLGTRKRNLSNKHLCVLSLWTLCSERNTNQTTTVYPLTALPSSRAQWTRRRWRRRTDLPGDCKSSLLST